MFNGKRYNVFITFLADFSGIEDDLESKEDFKPVVKRPSKEEEVC
jgi:hypothetical protein